MKTSFISRFILPVAVFATVAASALAEEKSVVRFSNPTEPGRIVVQIAMGDLTITGSDAKDVSIVSDSANRANPEPRNDGLRRLDSDEGFSATESGNVITVTLGNLFKGGRRGGSDMKITVPRATSVTVERAGPGSTSLKNIAGDLELRGSLGDMKLEEISGGVLVESVNGNVDATFAALSENKPVSITVVNGDVSLRVPTRSKANVRFRTLRGEVLTDFSEKELETRMENSSTEFSVNTKVDVAFSKTATVRARTDEARAATDREKMERDRERAERDRERAAADEARAIESAQAAASASPAHPPIPPKPPKPPKVMQPMSGGKLVVGSLNGGGPDLIVTAVSGTITLRKVP